MRANFIRLAAFNAILFTGACWHLHADDPPNVQPKLDLAGDPLPPGAFARLGSLRMRHDATKIAFRGPKELVSLGSTLRSWDLTTGKHTAESASEFLGESALSQFSGDGRILVTVHNPPVCRVWDTATCKLVKEFSPRGINPDDLPNQSAIAVSTDGKRIALVGGGSNRTIRIFDSESGKEEARIEAPSAVIARLAFSLDSKRLAASLSSESFDADKQENLIVWDVATGKVLANPKPKLRVIGEIAFTTDGGALALHVENGISVRSLDGRELWSKKVAGDEYALVFVGPKNLSVLVTGKYAEDELEQIQVVESTSGKKLRSWPASLDTILSGVFSPDGKLFAIAGSARIRVYDLETGKETIPTTGHSTQICTTCITPDSKHLASTDFKDKEVILWEIATGREVRRFRGHTDGCIEIVFSPDGKRMASSSYDRTVRIWDVATAKQLHKIEHGGDPMWHLRFSADGNTLATAPYRNGGVTVYEVATGKKLHEMAMGGGFLPSVVARHPDGRILVVDSVPKGGESEDGGGVAVQVWDLMAGRMILRLPGHTQGGLICSVLSPDGRTLATRGDDGKIRLWELASGQQRASFNEESSIGTTGTQFFAYSPDGRTIVSADRREPKVYLWDVPTGKQFGSFDAHSKPMYTLEFTPDGKSVLTGSQDSTILGWDMTVPERRSRSLPIVPQNNIELTGHWDRLRDDTPEQAWKSMWAMIRDPDGTVAFLRGKSRVWTPVPAEKIKGWIADLESQKFTVREKGERELTKNFDQAEPDLRAAAEKLTSTEARKRVARILEAGLTGIPDSETLRELRGIEVLEHIGTPKAKELLRELANSRVAAKVARDALQSIKRLEMK